MRRLRFVRIGVVGYLASQSPMSFHVCVTPITELPTPVILEPVGRPRPMCQKHDRARPIAPVHFEPIQSE